MTWTVDEQVRCDPVDCGDPPPTAHGTVSTTGTKLNDTATYSCDFGHRVESGDLERYLYLNCDTGGEISYMCVG